MTPQPAVRAVQVAVEYDDGPLRTLVFSDVSLTASVGDTLAVCGPSGSGKSSLLRILAGLQAPTRGHVAIEGRSFMVFQDARLVPFLTVGENLALAADLAGASIDGEAVNSILADLGLGEIGDRMPKTLSGGEAHRVAIGRAFAAGASVVLVDEPTASLDRATAQRVGGLLVDMASRRHAIVIVATHDEQLAARVDATIRLDAIQLDADRETIVEAGRSDGA